jgi:hypothetical protein
MLDPVSRTSPSRRRSAAGSSPGGGCEPIAAETGARPGDIRPWVTANALLGVHRALIGYARERILAGAENPRLAREVRAQAEDALAAVESGFGAERASGASSRR